MGKSQSKPTVSNFNRFFYLQDSDQVYERQWRLSNLSVTAIKDYLAKIKRRSLVLKECTKTVPPGNYEKTVMLNLLPKKESQVKHGLGEFATSHYLTRICPRQESNLHGIATTRPSTYFTSPLGDVGNMLQ